jgi:hypothetical protein
MLHLFAFVGLLNYVDKVKYIQRISIWKEALPPSSLLTCWSLFIQGVSKVLAGILGLMYPLGLLHK